MISVTVLHYDEFNNNKIMLVNIKAKMWEINVVQIIIMYKLNAAHVKNYLKSNGELVTIVLLDSSFIASQFYAVNFKFIAV